MHREYTRQVLSLMIGDVPSSSEQIPLPFFGKTIDVDGMKDPNCEWITYWGKASHVFDNVYRCYAHVGGTLAIVEITVTRLP